ncbi:C3HC zinc finger-like-domain-containing protein [Neohortaea acidophila]|uniref:C3HC zinc finger-like-domain-containing protein n=1 Tax=Neohortaea acidophila TaxID=245834 RepID=A0A6A6PRX6_9PEZI|nr:C3HC zinc finger-like-domain-containing protein [Neohortaea acidophila]KAF2482431.1 C3HC zinc finger-like-domain-containing protein [Neohortaea acidophila]
MTAIATKKRLYTKALDALSNNSQLSLAPSITEQTKRPLTAIEAFDEARERASKRLRQSTSSGSLRPIFVPSHATTTRGKDDSISKDPPNYSPWSHEAFLKRLKTFSSVSLWHPKPEAISEVEWAKRGWVCTGVNTVQCKGGCEKRLVVSLETASRKEIAEEQGIDTDAAAEDDDADESAFEQALTNRYHALIINGHADNCLWRKAGCKDDIYHLQVVRPFVWQPDLRKRFESLLAIPSAIEKIDVTSSADTTADAPSTPPSQLLADLSPSLLADLAKPHEATPYLPPKALQIALNGWRASKDASTELLHCDACFQRIGLWMYQPDYRPSHHLSPSTDDDDENEDDNSSAATLNLTTLHREHCPWRNAESQKASGSLSGLNAAQILLRVVSTAARDWRRRSKVAEPVAGAGEGEQNEGEAEAEAEELEPYSKEDVERLDKERESRLRRFKSMFSIKRKGTKGSGAKVQS